MFKSQKYLLYFYQFDVILNQSSSVSIIFLQSIKKVYLYSVPSEPLTNVARIEKRWSYELSDDDEDSIQLIMKQVEPFLMVGMVWHSWMWF